MNVKKIKNMYDDTFNESIPNLLFEASGFRNPILKEIDSEFLKLKTSDNEKDFLPIKKKLQNLIQKFTGAKHVFISIKKDMFNAYVIPIYNGTFYKKVSQSKSVEEKGIEGSEYIDRIYITFGLDLINKCNNKQLTAVLLHELGHAFLHKSHILSFIKKISILGIIPLKFGLNVPIGLALLLILRTLSFFDHKEEYNADKFAVKYGYGDDFAKLMLSVHKNNQLNKSKIRKIFDLFITTVYPSEHPRPKNRINKINNIYLKKYQKIYPDIKNNLTIIFKKMEQI